MLSAASRRDSLGRGSERLIRRPPLPRGAQPRPLGSPALARAPPAFYRLSRSQVARGGTRTPLQHGTGRPWLLAGRDRECGRSRADLARLEQRQADQLQKDRLFQIMEASANPEASGWRRRSTAGAQAEPRAQVYRIDPLPVQSGPARLFGPDDAGVRPVGLPTSGSAHKHAARSTA